MISENALKELRKLNAVNILVQVPEGLKTDVLAISKFLEKNGFNPVVSVEPCFGACDLRDTEAKELGCDAVLHIGHSDFGLRTVLPVVYELWHSYFDPVKLVMKNLYKLDYDKIGLTGTVQHVKSLLKLKESLEMEGKRVFVGNGGKLEPGQVLGCDYSNVKAVDGDVECFVFVGSGRFHADGFYGVTGKPVFFADTGNGTFSLMENNEKKREIKRQLRIEKARSKEAFGIFVSTKPGQMRRDAADAVMEMLRKKGKKAVMITADMITPDKILGIGIEVLVNTACPRICDDQELFGMPVLSPVDAEEI